MRDLCRMFPRVYSWMEIELYIHFLHLLLDCFQNRSRAEADRSEAIFVHLGSSLTSGFVGLSEIITNCNADGDSDHSVPPIDAGMDKWTVSERGAPGCGE